MGASFGGGWLGGAVRRLGGGISGIFVGFVAC